MSELDAEAGAELRYRTVRELALDSGGVVERLIAYLSDESWRVRKAAVDRLVELRPPESTIPALLEALANGDDARVRNAAAEALGRVGAPAIEALTRRLTSADPDVRKFAADVLGEIGLPEGIEPLAQALDDGDRNVRSSAAEALGKIGGARAAVALERALRVDDHLLRACALDGLSRIGATPRVEILANLALDRFLRRPVYRLLGRASDERALEILVQGVGDAGRSTREAALAGIAEQAHRASGLFGGRLALQVRHAAPPSALGSSRSALESADPQAVEGAILVIGALGSIHDAVAVAVLGGDERYREAAQMALASLGPGALELLRSALPRLAGASLRLVSQVLPAEDGPLLEARALDLIDLTPADGLEPLFEVLARVGGPRSHVALLSRVDDPLIGEGARRALERLAAGRPAEIRRMVREQWRARPSPALCLLLGELGDEQDLPQLLTALRSAESEVRVAAARALGRWPHRSGEAGEADRSALRVSAEAGLQQAALDEDEGVRAAAVRALGQLWRGVGGRPPPGGVLQVRDVVDAALADESELVVLAALEVAGLGVGRGREAVLGKLAASGSARLALAALDALDRLGGLGVEILRVASEHSHPDVVRAALLAAAARPAGMDLVEARLEHSRWEIRRVAARVMGLAGDVQAVPVLRAREARETDSLVVEALREAIGIINARRHG